MVLNSQKQHDEALVLVKEAIRAHITSPTCWHVLGLIHRAQGDYKEAMKSYKQALRLKPDNLNILRDMALLQIQTRDVAGFRETQRTMMMSKAGGETNWAGFALGLHMTGYTDLALQVLSKYEVTMGSKRGLNQSSSELVLLKTQLLEERGDIAAALEELTGGWEYVLDKHDATETKARLLSLQGAWEEAGTLWKALLRHVNPDNYVYHRGVIASILRPEDAAAALAGKGTATAVSTAEGLASLTPESTAALLEFYTAEAAVAKRCRAHQRMPLDFLAAEHPEFAPRLKAYLQYAVRKGVPSLSQDIKRLYSHPGKSEVIGQTLTTIHAEAEAAVTGGTGSPTDVMWALAHLAAHARQVGTFDEGLVHVEAALQHSPTVIELYSIKARLLKKLGRLGEAADVLVEARGLDLADRHINTKAVKYLLAAGRTKEGADTMALFARQEGDPLFNIIDMQHLWYCLHAARAYEAEGNVAMALKRYHNLHTHFNTFIEDQFDFHQYVLRKMNLRVYLAFLQWVDDIFAQPFYVEALGGLARQYLFLAQHPELHVVEEEDAEPTEEELAAMDKKERQKVKNRIKAARKRAAAAAAEAEAAAAALKAKGKKPPKTDQDPEGKEYLATKQPLAKAEEFARLWLAAAPTDAKAGIVAAKVALAAGKGAAAARGLHVALASAGQEEAAEVASVKAELEAWVSGGTAHPAVAGAVRGVLDGSAGQATAFAGAVATGAGR